MCPSLLGLIPLSIARLVEQTVNSHFRYHPDVKSKMIKQSGLPKLLERVNKDMGEDGQASRLVDIVGSDELAELVYKCSKGIVL